MAFHETILARYSGLSAGSQTFVRVVIVFAVGYLLLKTARAYLDGQLKKPSRLDQTLRVFLFRVAYGMGWIVLASAVLATVGVDLTALLGGLAIGGFVIGFALKDTLGNLAAGVMLVVYRPFNLGDTVTVGSHTGNVTELGIALTTIQLPDGKTVTVPNGSVLGGAIVNFNRTPTRRVEVAVGIAYEDDIDAATKALLEMAATDARILADPKPQVVVTALGESSVDLELRAWVNNADFGGVFGAIRKHVKQAVEQAGCSIPFPQRDIHVLERTPAGRVE